MVIFYLYKKRTQIINISIKQKMDEEESIIDPFSTPDDISDVTLIVEDKKIFSHKAILGKNKTH
jgi:hypothetical protein